MTNSHPRARGGLHIVVGAGPRPEAGIVHEVRLLKAALLYADRVTLCSARGSIYMRGGLQFRDLTFDQQLRAFDGLLGTLATPEEAALVRAAIAKYKRLSQARRRTTDELLRVRDFRRGLEGEFSKLVARVTSLATEAGTAGLFDALNSGLVELHPLNAAHPTLALVDEFISVVSSAVASGSSYPLLDDSTSVLIDAMIREGELDVTEGARLRGKSARLAAMLFDRLPLFDQASVSELLDVRRALDGPLARFRGAMLTLSKDLESGPWDKNFQSDAEVLITREIEPAVADIEAAVRDNRLSSALVRTATEKPAVVASGTVIGAALSLVVSQATALPSLVAAALGPAVGSGLAALNGYEQWREKQAAAERHQLYFYYRVGRALGR